MYAYGKSLKERYKIHSTQSFMVNAGILENSLTLFVTSVRFSERA